MAAKKKKYGATLVGELSPKTGRLTSFPTFKPYKPPPVPTGSYDPAIDAQVGQVNRGLGDTKQDIETANTRDTVDYGLQTDATNRAFGRTDADLTTAYGRDQDAYNTAIGNLTRNYGILAGQQAEGARHAGVMSGGIAMLSAAKRAANEAVDRQPIDTTWQQQQQDIGTARSRATEDRDLQLGQVALDYAPPSADNPLGGRRFQDRTTTLTRAEREGTQFGLDANAEKLFQATQVGYVPPSKGQPGGMPSNEGMTATGSAYRTVTSGGWVYRYDQHGKLISRSRAASKVATNRGGNRSQGVGRL